MLDLFTTREFIIFTTRDFARHENMDISAASKFLSRLSGKKLLRKITKGVWANVNHPYFHPLSCVPYLLGKEQGYVSFLTALHLHGLISQIPANNQIATTGHTRKLVTSQGTYEFIQMKPELMREGITWSETQLPFLLASPEKALLDVLYIATRKNRRFSKLPELELSANTFDSKKFRNLFSVLPLSSRIKNAMETSARTLGIIGRKSR